MKHLLEENLSITDVRLAIYVERGTGMNLHRARPTHGIAAVFSPNIYKHYRFGDGRILSLGQNDLIYLPKGSDYEVRGNVSGECFAINFELSEGTDLPPFTSHLHNAPRFQQLFQAAVRLWQERPAGYLLRIKSILYEILATLLGEQDLQYVDKSAASRIEPALERIRKGYRNELPSVKELAALCSLSEDYFRKLFQAVYGTTPLRYINELRIGYAEELLHSGLYTVGEVALLSGFTDAAYFSRAFKRATGHAPSK